MKLLTATALLLFAAFWVEMAHADVRIALAARYDADHVARYLRNARSDAAHYRRMLTVWQQQHTTRTA